MPAAMIKIAAHCAPYEVYVQKMKNILWYCNGLSSLRESLISEIKCVLGQQSEDFMQLDTRSRTLCLFGGNCYLLETQCQMALLKAILVPIHQMYVTRCTLL